jgi:hypothetical protein
MNKCEKGRGGEGREWDATTTVAPDKSDATNHRQETTCWSRRLPLWNKGYYCDGVPVMGVGWDQGARGAYVRFINRHKHTARLDCIICTSLGHHSCTNPFKTISNIIPTYTSNCLAVAISGPALRRPFHSMPQISYQFLWLRKFQRSIYARDLRNIFVCGECVLCPGLTYPNLAYYPLSAVPDWAVKHICGSRSLKSRYATRTRTPFRDYD